jgi:hypothetical protein
MTDRGMVAARVSAGGDAAAHADALLRRWSAAQAERSGFATVWQEIADHLLGRRDFVGAATPGRKRLGRIYDSTGLQAADTLAAALHSLLTNPAGRWFSLRPEDTALAGDRQVRDWLDAAEDVMYAAFAAAATNFAPQIHEVYLDEVAFGTAALYVGDRPGRGLLFSARPLGEIAIAENAEGRVDTVFRKFRFTARPADEAWGAAAGPAVRRAIAAGRPEQQFAFLHCVTPRRGRAPATSPAASPATASPAAALPVASYYLALDDAPAGGGGGVGGGGAKGRLIAESGYHEMPYMVPRWSKDAGEVYGRAPGWNALADQKMLNEMSKTVLKAAQKAVDPPLLVADDGVIMPLRTEPGGVNVVRAGALAHDPLRPLANDARIDIGLEMMEQRRGAIRNAFHHGVLQLFQDPRMTATQVLQLVTEMQRLMGPMLGRQQAELLEPMIERVFGILERAGALPPPPAILAGRTVRIDYVSPIARAQKSGEAQAVLRTLEAAQAFALLDPRVADNLDGDAGLRAVAEATGAPARLLRSEADVAALRLARSVAGGVAEIPEPA